MLDLEEWKYCTIAEHYLTIRFSDLWKTVDERLHGLTEVRGMVVEDPEILRGTPVIRGTRIPVHDVAAQVEAGVPIKEILESYPRLSAAQVELASIYAKAVPQRGRPLRLSIPGTKPVSVTKKRLHGSL